jgi:Ca2+-binding RTX toxin-like protein
MATWTVAETADDKFDVETFFSLNGLVLENNSDADIVYYQGPDNPPTYYVIHAYSNPNPAHYWVTMDFQTHIDSGNQTHAVLSDIFLSAQDFDTLTSTHTGADVAGVLFQGNDTLTGSSHDDILRGYAGKDSLDGGTGDDAMYGGTGNDSYVVDSTGDTVIELHGGGKDTVNSSVSFTLGDSVENLTLLDPANPVGKAAGLKGTGNDLGNNIEGNSGNNVLSGLGGADRLDGGKGNDKLSGGEGADTFVFAKGDGQDTITDFQAAGAGHDKIDLSRLPAVTDFRELRQHDMEDHGKDVWIDVGKDVLVIRHADIHDLSKADFHF